MKTVQLGDIAEVIRGVAYDKMQARSEPAEDLLPILRAGNIQSDLVADRDLVFVPKAVISARQHLRKDDIVICMSSGSADVVGKVAICKEDWTGSFGAFCGVIRIEQERACPAYLLHMLRMPNFRSWTMKALGANIKNIRKSELQTFPLNLPPLDEQRRIAAILDKADAIRRKRQQALALADDFLRSAFLEMFGDPVTNPKGWQISPVEKLLGKPLRNGVSPSSTGRHPASVLTLSAITGQGFDPQSAKAGLFDLPVAVSDTVQKGEFYICRGNGNSNLVGKGYFATCSMEGTAFPDTMIAAMPDPELVTKEYFEQVWNSRFVRSQIVQAARTTNGTFKVNQTAIESIRVPVPPSNFQEEFSRKVMAAQRARVRILEGLEQAGTLFTSLSQRAFRGEL